MWVSKHSNIQKWNWRMLECWNFTFVYALVTSDGYDHAWCTCRYSCDEGRSWNDFSFSNEEVVVWGVVTEPGQTTTQVMSVISAQLFYVYVCMYVHFCRLFNENNSSRQWIVTHINFTSIFSHTCEDSDYYEWHVSNGVINFISTGAYN